MKIKVALISFLANSINTRLLSSYLKQHGYESTCYFCPEDFNPNNIIDIINKLKNGDISLVGVSLVTDDYFKAVQVTEEIKKHLDIPVIWGGAHVNIKPEESLRHADMICLGEGEDALLELVRKLSEFQTLDTSIKNIWFNSEDGIIRNELRNLEENLDKYPFPDFDLLSQFIMEDAGLRQFDSGALNSEYSIMTSRGCPYKCHYCYNSYRSKQYSGKGKYLRTRSIANVIAELLQAKKIFPNLKEINFWDDSFVARKTEDFIDFKNQYTEKIKLPFFALIEPMAYDPSKIEILRESGLAKLQVGIQSGSERVNREVYNRPVSNVKVLEVANSINSMGISVIYDLIFNNPYETRNDLDESLKLLLKFPRPFQLQGYNLIFYPGAEITERALNDGYISSKENVEDFSTIQGEKDSPTSRHGDSEVSSRFYSINYTSQEKLYPNAVISLLALNKVPLSVFRYFASQETWLKRLQLKLFYRLYANLSRLKNGMFGSQL